MSEEDDKGEGEGVVKNPKFARSHECSIIAMLEIYILYLDKKKLTFQGLITNMPCYFANVARERVRLVQNSFKSYTGGLLKSAPQELMT